jgi:hypothetical protein
MKEAYFKASTNIMSNKYMGHSQPFNKPPIVLQLAWEGKFVPVAVIPTR